MPVSNHVETLARLALAFREAVAHINKLSAREDDSVSRPTLSRPAETLSEEGTADAFEIRVGINTGPLTGEGTISIYLLDPP